MSLCAEIKIKKAKKASRAEENRQEADRLRRENEALEQQLASDPSDEEEEVEIVKRSTFITKPCFERAKVTKTDHYQINIRIIF